VIGTRPRRLGIEPIPHPDVVACYYLSQPASTVTCVKTAWATVPRSRHDPGLTDVCNAWQPRETEDLSRVCQP